MWLQYWRRGDEIPESRASKRRKSGREGETPEPSVAPKVVNTNIPQFVNTPKNFEGGKLANYFDKWKNFTKDNWILEQVLGVKVELENVKLPEKKEINFKNEERKTVEEEIKKLLDKKVIHQVQDVQGQVVSNVFVRRKKDGSYRMILNLKDMNKLIEKKKFKMETLKSAISLMKENCFFASLDLKEA